METMHTAPVPFPKAASSSGSLSSAGSLASSANGGSGPHIVPKWLNGVHLKLATCSACREIPAG
jgi:hypothetical protein